VWPKDCISNLILYTALVDLAPSFIYSGFLGLRIRFMILRDGIDMFSSQRAQNYSAVSHICHIADLIDYEQDESTTATPLDGVL
jgi:hypothetical protein